MDDVEKVGIDLAMDGGDKGTRSGKGLDKVSNDVGKGAMGSGQ